MGNVCASRAVPNNLSGLRLNWFLCDVYAISWHFFSFNATSSCFARAQRRNWRRGNEQSLWIRGLQPRSKCQIGIRCCWRTELVPVGQLSCGARLLLAPKKFVWNLFPGGPHYVEQFSFGSTTWCYNQFSDSSCCSYHSKSMDERLTIGTMQLLDKRNLRLCNSSNLKSW